MSFKIEADDRDRFFVRLTAEPEFIHGLWMAPPQREQFLDSGDWVVLTFAIWSVNDRPAIATSIEVAKEMQGRVSLGIRPFEALEEFATWCGDGILNGNLVEVGQEQVAESNQITIGPVAGQTPIWVFLRGGAVYHIHQGSLDRLDLRSLIDQVFQRELPLIP